MSRHELNHGAASAASVLTPPAGSVVVRDVGHVGRITLSRPERLNALDLDMVRVITAALVRWRDDKTVKAVIVDSQGDRAFCAGGDIRRLHASGQARDGDAEAFWREEYALNTLIHNYPKPYIALIDGVTMGGGVGLSVHGDFRVATERTVLAMPETGIGFYPDVGATYVLPRLAGRIGVWMGLTGARLSGADAIAAGLATHFILSANAPHLLAVLEGVVLDKDGASVDATLHAHEVSPGPSELARRQEQIDRYFAADTVEEILEALDSSDDPWAHEQAAVLRAKSPTSLKVTMQALRDHADLHFEDAIARELTISQAFLQQPDFYEGVRAAVIDKDRTPTWSPPQLTAVSQAEVDAFFPR